jgi:aminoglycoside phosphotransferase (APT) family kinase protein
MHDGEASIGLDLVRELLVAQFPSWADLSLDMVASSGTVNAVFRLGDQMCVRLPRLQKWAEDLKKELRWLPILAPSLSLSVPQPLAQGRPDYGYPFSWAIYEWLPGDTFRAGCVSNELRAAESLAQFIMELRRIDPSVAPRSQRDWPLRMRDIGARAAIRSLDKIIDTDAATAAWVKALESPEWDGCPTWTHGDLLPSNLVVERRQLSGVIDFGNMGVGDPAVDVIAAWSVFSDDARKAFRSALDVDDATWARARGFALHQALLIIPYYRETNPKFAATARGTVAAVLADCT